MNDQLKVKDFTTAYHSGNGMRVIVVLNDVELSVCLSGERFEAVNAAVDVHVTEELRDRGFIPPLHMTKTAA